MIPRSPNLCFRHDCLNSGCRIHDCTLCKYCQRKRCEKASGFSEKYLANGDVIEARCGAPIRVEVIDPTTKQHLREFDEFTLRICILDGSKYEKLDSDQKMDLEALSACALLLNNKGQPLLAPGKAAHWDEEKRVLVNVTGGSVFLPDLKVTDSSEAMLGGKQPNFYLLLEPVNSYGSPADAEFLVSEGFVVATQRTKPYIKVEIPHVDDHVSKVNSIGAQTQKKLEDLRAAAAAANVPDLNVPFNSITKVGQLKELVEMAERNKPLRENLKQVLRLTKGWESVRDHVMMAVDTDRRLRVWYADNKADYGLVFQCTTYNVVDLQNPVGVLRRKLETGYAEIYWSTKSGPESEVISQMLPYASESWWKPGHPQWYLLPENLSTPDWEKINGQEQPSVTAAQVPRPNESGNYGPPASAPSLASQPVFPQRAPSPAVMAQYDVQQPQTIGMHGMQFQGMYPGYQMPTGRHRVVTSGQHSQQPMADAVFPPHYDQFQYPRRLSEQQPQLQQPGFIDSNSFERLRMQQAPMERAHLFPSHMTNHSSPGPVDMQHWQQFQGNNRSMEEQAMYNAHLQAQLRANSSTSSELPPPEQFRQHTMQPTAGPSYNDTVYHQPNGTSYGYMPHHPAHPQPTQPPAMAHPQSNPQSRNNSLPDHRSLTLQEQMLQRRADGLDTSFGSQGQQQQQQPSPFDLDHHQHDSLIGNSSSLQAHRNLMQQQLLYEQQQQQANAAAAQHWMAAAEAERSLERPSLKRERSEGVGGLQSQPSGADNLPLASPFESPDVQNVMRMLVATQPGVRKQEQQQQTPGPESSSHAQAKPPHEKLQDSLTRWRDASTQQQQQHHQQLPHLPDADIPTNMSMTMMSSFLSSLLDFAGNDPSMTDGRGELNSQALMDHIKRFEAQQAADGHLLPHMPDSDPMSSSGPLPTVSSDFLETVLSMLKQGESLDHVLSALQESVADLAGGPMPSWLPNIPSWPANHSGFQQDGPMTSGLENMQSVEEALNTIRPSDK